MDHPSSPPAGGSGFSRDDGRRPDWDDSSDGQSRRRVLRNSVVAIGTLTQLSGCLGYEIVSSEELDSAESRAADAERTRIIDQYRDGMELRSAGSKHWHRGGDRWTEKQYQRASSHFDRAAGYYDAATLQFQHARELSSDEGYDEAESICEQSENYCGELSVASHHYSTAARSYAEEDESAGERLRERGFDRYRNALDFEIAPISSLEDSLESPSTTSG